MFNVNHVRADQQYRREQERTAKRRRMVREAQHRTENRDHKNAWMRVVSVFL